jgi:hypothetical protein
MKRTPQTEIHQRRWALFIGPHEIGQLIHSSHETPWTTAVFVASANFERFKPYLDWRYRHDTEDGDNKDEDIEASLDPEAEQLFAKAESLGGLRIEDLQTGDAWAPTVHFDPDHTGATFR